MCDDRNVRNELILVMAAMGGKRTFGSTTLLLLLAEIGLTSVGFK